MRMWKWLGIVCGLIALGYWLICGGSCKERAEKERIRAVCIAKYGHASPVAQRKASSSGIANDLALDPPCPSELCEGLCPTEFCGTNGPWWGRGVRFRTLHQDGTANPQGLVIRDFQTKDGDHMRLDVHGDVLRGFINGQWNTGDELEGAEIIIDHLTPPHSNLPKVDATYVLKIVHVERPDFLAQPGCVAGGTCSPDRAWIYQFTVTSSEGCDLQLCRPGNTDDYEGGLSGKAAIFRGDRYDENTSVVQTVTESPSGIGAVFNIACLGSATSKEYLLQHTSVIPSEPAGIPAPLGPRPSQPERQTLLRLLRADYCGNGASYTDDGLQIDLDFNNATYRPTLASQYQLVPADTLDALWGPDGAVCLGEPRVTHGKLPNEIADKRAEIKNACHDAGHDLTDCAPGAMGAPFGMGNYAISANPAP